LDKNKENIKHTIELFISKISSGTLIDTELLYLLCLLDLLIYVVDVADPISLNKIMMERDKLDKHITEAIKTGNFAPVISTAKH
jgi:hypothetical protein